ncbi:TolC family protein [Thalassolituus sp. ST750PaO-4]|uniref:TolC family protein n=1 Tax=Thalassolituus sp. ST750PaO-4 TaxID=2742965 RepID=UPI001CE31BD5|nr:TolC family protein [Thalassolituus sp. ST750PaO-4]MCA6060215.1 TolC family protein [Thalassolituus sp. ST750PaO-4]
MMSFFTGRHPCAQAIVFVLLCWPALRVLAAEPGLGLGLSLEQTREYALQSDPALRSQRQLEQAYRQDSAASRYWPNPKIALNAQNLPTDSWSFEQEPMTQIQLGISQMLPRGDSLDLQAQKQSLMAGLSRENQALRARELRREVSLLWLEAARAQAAEKLTAEHLQHLQQQAAVLNRRYRNASGLNADSGPQQQDLLRVELETQRIRERLLNLQQQYQAARQRLNEWLPPGEAMTALALEDAPRFEPAAELVNAMPDDQALAAVLMQHPLWAQTENRVASAAADIELARQEDKAQWGIQASYGYRGDDAMGNDRADFVSVGVSVDLPLFNGERNERKVAASVRRREAEQTRQQLLLRQLLSAVRNEWAQYQLQRQRLEFYDQTLLPQISRQLQAVKNSYGQDRDDFNDVIRAVMERLNGDIERLNLLRELHKTAIRLEFYAPGFSAPSPAASAAQPGMTSGHGTEQE